MGAAATFHGFAIEPYAVQVTRHAVAAPGVARLRLAQLSDLHTHGYGQRERRIVKLLVAEEPDAVVVTGDVVDEGDLEPARQLFERLRELRVPRGVLVVRGNWEHWRPPSAEEAFWRSVGAELLVNRGVELAPGVYVTGFDDALAGAPLAEAALHDTPGEAFVVALFHSPAFFDTIADRVDLALAGHTHGGQVRVPLFGPPWLPPGSGRFVAGWYGAERPPRAGGRRGRLYVSRGLGTSIVPLRFACPPELAIFDVGR